VSGTPFLFVRSARPPAKAYQVVSHNGDEIQWYAIPVPQIKKDGKTREFSLGKLNE